MTARAAVPARFDAGSQRRRSLLAKVHVARKQLGLVDDDYRAVLIRTVHAGSAKDLSESQLLAVLKEFERLGFDSKVRAPSPKGKPRPADNPMAGKARAMWISLHLLGAVQDASEAALEAFARRQLRVAKMQWADQAKGYKLIEALKAIAERHGWLQSTEGVPPYGVRIVLKRRLVEALMGKLWQAGLIPADWDVERTAWELGGIEDGKFLLAATAEELDAIARVFGTKLRTPIAPLSAEEYA